MIDKQIIIDGVDVAECENLMQGIVPFGCMEDRKTCSCMNNPNCRYKLYKRKEQECEELKKELMKKDEVNTFFNTPIEGWSNDPCGTCKYKQTLIEIKEIAMGIMDDDLEESSAYYDAKQILQKISKCGVGNDSE